jgi:hypothetical protein
VNLGSGVNLAYGFSSTNARSYVRLKYSTATNITSEADGDFDGDGISNLDEVAYFGTDPFTSNDPDGDGYLSADEIAQGSDPNLASSKPFDPLNPPQPNRYVAPLSWWVENKFQDSVERATVQNDSAATTRWTTRANSLADGSYDFAIHEHPGRSECSGARRRHPSRTRRLQRNRGPHGKECETDRPARE